MNRAFIRNLRIEIDNALKAVGEKHNVSIHAGNARFDETSVSFKLQVNQINENGKVESPERKAFIEFSHVYGVDKNIKIDDKLRLWDGNVYQIVGLKTKSRKYPVLAKQLPNGKTYKFTPDAINAGTKIAQLTRSK